MKTCTKCSVCKPLTEFYTDKRSKTIYRSECKSCSVIRQTEQRKSDPEAARVASRKQYLKHKENYAATRRAYQTWYLTANREKCNAAQRKYRLDNPGNAAKSMAKWRNANREVNLARLRAAYEANPGKYIAYARARDLSKVQRMPKSLTREDLATISLCYTTSTTYSGLFGVAVHVDHIIPLRGKNVSGLHVPWNLRIITGAENLSKGVKWADTDALANSTSFEDTIARRLGDLVCSLP